MLSREYEMSKSIDVYNDPCFTLKDAQLHIYAYQVPPRTIFDWVVGSMNYQPLIDIAEKKPARLSFVNLVELYVLASIRRKYRVRMQNVRPAIDFMKKEFNTEHPLAEHRFQTDGFNLFYKHLDSLYDLSRGGQQNFDFIEIYLKRIEYNPSGNPLKFYPFTRLDNQEDSSTPRYVTIDPKICFGRPILESTSVPVEIISQKYWAGESHASLINEYAIEAEELDEAIRVGGYYLKAA